MSGAGVIVSDPWLQSQLTQVELRSLNSKVHTPLSLSLFHYLDLNLYIKLSGFVF